MPESNTQARENQVDVHLVSFSPLKNRTDTRLLGHAIFTIAVNGVDILLIRNCAVVREQSHLHVNMPNRRKADGGKQWEPYVVFSDPVLGKEMHKKLSLAMIDLLNIDLGDQSC